VPQKLLQNEARLFYIIKIRRS